jgi:hypothetical protein
LIIKNIEGIEGKIIAKAKMLAGDEMLGLLFKDGDYAVIEVRQNYDMTEVSINCDPSYYELLELGAITQTEFDSAQNRKHEACFAESSLRRRRIFFTR